MRRRTRGMLYGAAVIAAAALGLFLSAGRGVSPGALEETSRASQKIDPDWAVSQSVGDVVAALLFYDGSGENCTYAVYLRVEGTVFPAYRFRMGGSAPGMVEGVGKLEFGEKGSAILSMNRPGVARIELVSDGGAVTVVEVDPDEPFAVALPPVGGAVSMYDRQGETVPFSCITGIGA